MADGAYSLAASGSASGEAGWRRPSWRLRAVGSVAIVLLGVGCVGVLSSRRDVPWQLGVRGVALADLVDGKGVSPFGWNDGNGRCLTVGGRSAAEGAPVLLSGCQAGSASQDFFRKGGMVVAKRDEQHWYCVTMGMEEKDIGWPLLLYPCDFHNRGQLFTSGESKEPVTSWLVDGTSHSGIDGLYALSDIVPSETHGGKPIYKKEGARPRYLFYWQALDLWIIGDDYTRHFGLVKGKGAEPGDVRIWEHNLNPTTALGSWRQKFKITVTVQNVKPNTGFRSKDAFIATACLHAESDAADARAVMKTCSPAELEATEAH